MKKIILISFLLSVFIFSARAQHDSTAQSRLSGLLTSYYDIKDALVSGKATEAAAKADQFIKMANGIDYKVVSEGNLHILLKDATAISESKDISKQRITFANLSLNMATLAKTVKLSSMPVYQQYCPMKKTYWLSNEKAIRNPYYGSSMLTCGQVTDTFTRN